MTTVMTKEEWERSYKRKCQALMWKRRRETLVLSVASVVLIGVIMCGVWLLEYAGNADYYAETGHITENGTFYIMDGYRGIYYNGEFIDANEFSDFSNGDKVRVEIDTQYTETTSDDVVVSVNKRWF